MSTAFEHLCELCSPNTSIEVIDIDKLDWQAIWELAIRHRVVPVMADRIKQLDLAPPQAIAQRIKEHNQENLLKGMQHAKEIVRLTQLFNDNNIKFVVFKGIALTQLMGQALHQRHHGDIDILLADVNDLWFVDKTLSSNGYDRLLPNKRIHLNKGKRKNLIKYNKDLTYVHKKNGIHLELHFKLFSNSYLAPSLHPEIIFEEKEIIKVTNKEVPIMSRNSTLLYLLVHGANSQWFRLKWLCDIPIISNNGIAYRTLISKHKELERIIFLGLYLSYSLLKMPIPEKTKITCLSEEPITFILDIAKKQLTGDEHLSLSSDRLTMLKRKVKQTTYAYNLKNDFRFRATEIIINLTSPKDWDTLYLPSQLTWLYFFFRPLLWFKRTKKYK